MLNDLRYAVRAIGKAPLLTAALVVSLGIGTGANAAVFNFISALLLRPPAGIENASTLAIVRAARSAAGDAGLASHTDLAELRASRAFEAVSAYDDSVVTGATFDGTTRRARVASGTGDLFLTLGMKASMGRLLTPGDSGTAVISHRLWDVIGRPDIVSHNSTITIDGAALPIVGVAPEGFRGMHPGRATDVWRLLREPKDDAERRERHLSVLARTGDAAGVAARLGGRFAVLRYSFLEPDRASETALLGAVLTGATLLVLICACVNAASLLLSRGNARRADLAVKLALGASRGGLIRQLLIESAIIGIAGGIAGLLFAYWTTTIVPSLFAPEHAEMLDAGLSTAIVITTLAGSTVLGVALGIMPALYGTAPVTALDLRADAGSVSQSGGASRAQTVLVVSQIALSMVLLVSALLLNRSLTQALEGDMGEGARNMVVATISEPPRSFNPPRGLRAFAQIENQLKDVAAVEQAGFAAALPVGAAAAGTFSIETSPGVFERVETDTNSVSLTYFQTLETPIVEGRAFSETDTFRSQPVAIINDVAMRRFFGGSAIGRKLIDARGDAIEIVGVVPAGRYRTMQESPAPMVYRPLAQEYVPRMYLVMRTRRMGSPDFYRAVRPSIQAPGTQVRRIAGLQEYFTEALVIDRFIATLVSACGLMALLLAIAGAYSLMLDSVQRRTREIGLRIALGASTLRISRSIAAFGLALTAAGVVAGLALILAAEQIARAFVLGLPRADLATMAITAAGLLLVVLLAGVVPTLRAVRVNPTVALRHT
ncbi:MAG: ABC transporter permease [Vicinamibacterales bacterium]